MAFLGEPVIVTGWEELEFSEGPDVSHVPDYRKGTEVSSVGPESMGGLISQRKLGILLTKEGESRYCSGGEKHTLCTISAPPRDPAEQHDFYFGQPFLGPSELCIYSSLQWWLS